MDVLIFYLFSVKKKFLSVKGVLVEVLNPTVSSGNK